MKEPIKTIPDSDYTGYYWMSDSPTPVEVIGNFPTEKLQNNSIPFVLEGNLFDKEKNMSITIRHDGEKHIICQYDLNNMEGIEKHEVYLIPHRLRGKERMIFWELWKEEVDALCDGMKTLKPYARLFAGFDNN